MANIGTGSGIISSALRHYVTFSVNICRGGSGAWVITNTCIMVLCYSYKFILQQTAFILFNYLLSQWIMLMLVLKVFVAVNCEWSW